MKISVLNTYPFPGYRNNINKARAYLQKEENKKQRINKFIIIKSLKTVAINGIINDGDIKL